MNRPLARSYAPCKNSGVDVPMRLEFFIAISSGVEEGVNLGATSSTEEHLFGDRLQNTKFLMKSETVISCLPHAKT